MVALLNMPRAAWKRQPSGIVEIDYSSPLLSEVKQFFIPVGHGHIVSHVSPFVNTTAKIVVDSGHLIKFNGGSGYLASDFGLITSSSWSQVFTGRLNIYNTSEISTLAGGVLSETRDHSIHYHYLEGAAAYIYDGGSRVVATNDGSANDVGKYILLSAQCSPTNLKVNKNRVSNSISVSNTGAIYTAKCVLGYGGFYNYGMSTHSLHSYFYFTRYLRDDEISLFLDPHFVYTLLKKSTARFYLIPSSGGVITLVVQDATHSHSVDATSLTQAHVLALADSLHGHSVESPILSQAYALTLAAAAHAHNAESLGLTQAHQLSVAEAIHNHSVDSPALFQAHILNVSDALHGHSVDIPVLTMAGSLIVAEASHNHSVDALNLTQAHTITLQDASHGHGVDAVTLTQAYVLVPADTVHGHSSDAPTLSTEFNLAVADGLHSHTVDAPGLTQAHVLSLADALHGHSVESVAMGQGYSLIVAEATHSHSVESPTVSVAFILAVQDALHSQAVDALLLATHVTLIVSDALHAHLAGTATEITLPTGDRVFLVAYEDRLFLVATEDHVFGV